MPTIRVNLTDNEVKELEHLAQREKRTRNAQAALLINMGLSAKALPVGRREGDAPAPPQDHDETHPHQVVPAGIDPQGS